MNEWHGISTLTENDVGALGESFDNRRSISHTLTEQWNGTQWSVVKSPNVGTDHNELFAIDATPGGTLWAVGTVYRFPQQQTLIERKLPQSRSGAGRLPRRRVADRFVFAGITSRVWQSCRRSADESAGSRDDFYLS